MTSRRMTLGLALSGPGGVTKFRNMLASAQMAEGCGFDFLWLTDRPGLDPITMAAALAATTQRIGLIPSCAAPYHRPYNLARRLASIDHISRGRMGWMLQPVADAALASKFGNLPLADVATAHAVAAEFAGVVAALWDSWDDDAFIRDKASGLYFDRAKFHWLDHQGAAFKVRGPLDTARPPQGLLPLLIAGGSALAEQLAAGQGEILHGLPADLRAAQGERAVMSRRLEQAGRAPAALRMLPGILPILGRTPTALPSGPGPLPVLGTPEAIAGTLCEWFDSGAADGFIIHLPDTADAIEAFAAGVIPVLQRHGAWQPSPLGATLRDMLGLGHAPSRYAEQAAQAVA
ncbi:LLM class flavin-dependent oxidoreductase [Humitalea rosea]|uniref:LLM class flavin-dependent oxidoreductase n=1 Tax=Humitalea rosea TaxID=990373 RepID=UPI0013148734|nr:LLM class flavin-dependent oxidoreductase [Humitalea rosea]